MGHDTFIPEAVRKQVEREEADLAAAKEAQKKRMEKKVDTPPAEPVVDAPADEVPVVAAPDVPPADQATEPTDTPVDELVELKRKLALAEQRNATLQGMIKAKNNQSDKSALESVQAELAAIKEQIANRPTEPSIPAKYKYLEDEEREVYGKEADSVEVRMARGIAEELVEKRIAAERDARLASEARLAALEKLNAEARGEAGESAVLDAAEAILPGAKEINRDILFIDWLNKKDPYNVRGASYNERGQAAMDRGDAHGVAELMREFLKDTPEADPRIAAQIMPSKIKGTETAPVVKKPKVTQSEAVAFYHDKARGQLRNADGSPMSVEEAARIEGIIDEALRTGDVVLV
jgi:hypothetical protein